MVSAIRTGADCRHRRPPSPSSATSWPAKPVSMWNRCSYGPWLTGPCARPLDEHSVCAVADLATTYGSLALGTGDASVIAVAERLELTNAATLNPLHFTVVRPGTRMG